MLSSVLHAIPKTIAIILAGISLFWSNSALAAKHERAPAVVLVRPSELPLAAQRPGQAMYLRAVGFSRYLYIEQDNGKHLAVFDVSHPARIKALVEIELDAPSFEFLAAVNKQFVLIRYKDPTNALGLGVLDLRHPKRPVLRNVGTAGVPSSPSSMSDLEESTRSIAGIENGQQKIITDEKLGSRFVLSADGLWIVRQPSVEKDFELEEIQYYAD